MASEIAQPFYDKLRKHYETGVRWQDMNFTEEQKKRIEVCIDAYNRFSTDPFINLHDYIQNKWNRSYSELRNDLKTVEFITSFNEVGERARSTRKVRYAADLLMKSGADTGNMKSLADGASLLFKLEGLDKPPTSEDMDANMAKMPIMVVTDVSRKYKNKQSHDTKEMQGIRKKYGAKQDHWQEMVEKRSGEYVPVGSDEYDDDEEEEELEANETYQPEENETEE